ncbi:MAG: GNAT family N-acetyltransferase [Candidatus Kapaibacterium sp.]
MTFITREMNENEIHYAIDAAAKEGWNPGINDGKCFYQTDPYGFFVSEMAGEIAGCISAVAYQETYGFIGFFIVDEKYRASNIGMALGMRAMKYLGQRIIGIDGVVERVGNYRNLGFELAHRNVRFEGVGGGVRPDGLTDLNEIPFESLADYDARHFPVRRERFLRCWIDMPNAIGYAVKSGDKIDGYGVIRSCRTGYKIGPLFANDEHIGRQIFAGLISKADGQPYYFDIPEPNEGAQRIVKDHKMQQVFETSRMYKNGMPDLPIDNIFSITSFELG